MEKLYTVRLENNTIGTLSTLDPLEDYIGIRVTVSLHDENGNDIEQTGILDEVLDCNTAY